MAFRTSFWWPDVRVSLDEDGEVEGTERGREELTKKGTKRKRAPYTKGPCEHGVKYRARRSSSHVTLNDRLDPS